MRIPTAASSFVVLALATIILLPAMTGCEPERQTVYRPNGVADTTQLAER